jgi:hypothetical protein
MAERKFLCRADARRWIPAFAGMTKKENKWDPRLRGDDGFVFEGKS